MLASRDREQMPADLLELHRELETIDIHERPSFGPELRAELEDAARRGWTRPRPRTRVPMLMAASIVLLCGLIAAPSARASIVELLGAVQTRLGGAPEVAPRPVPVSLEPPGSTDLEQDPVFIPLAAAQPEAEPVETPAPWSGTLADLAPYDAYPSLLDRDGVDDLVRWFYPDRLERQGVGGVVRLILWVEADGSVADRQVARTSGNAALDAAALRAAEHFRFTPARRRGQPVGTWVEFDVNVQAAPGSRTLSGIESVQPGRIP